jgi:hypothetical protein
VLGELHAPGTGGHVRAGNRHLPRADLGQRRHVGLDDAPHRGRGTRVRRRRELLHARHRCARHDPGPRRDLPG